MGAIWVRTSEKVTEVRQTIDATRVPLVTHDYDAILNDDSIDLISIVTPPGAHKDMATRALQKKKHVLCDKPTALNASEALFMAKVAKENLSQLSFFDHELRFVRNYQEMRRLVQTKETIGDLRHIEVSVQFRPQAHQSWTWWQDKSQGGGLLGAIGSHYIDLISFVAGSRFASVIGIVETVIPTLPDGKGEPRACTADHYASFQFRLTNGVFGIVHLTLAPHQAPNHKFTFIGATGTAVMEQLDLTVSNASGVVSKTPEPFGPEPVQQHVWAIGTYHFATELLAAVQKTKEKHQTHANSLVPTAATFEDALYVQTVLDAVRKSTETRAWVDISATAL